MPQHTFSFLASVDDGLIKLVIAVIVGIIWAVGAAVKAISKKTSQPKSWDQILGQLSGNAPRPPGQPAAPIRQPPPLPRQMKQQKRPPQRPAAAPAAPPKPRFADMPAAGTSAAMQTSAPIQTIPSSAASQALTRVLRDRRKLRGQMVFAEILGKPVALRE